MPDSTSSKVCFVHSPVSLSDHHAQSPPPACVHKDRPVLPSCAAVLCCRLVLSAASKTLRLWHTLLVEMSCVLSAHPVIRLTFALRCAVNVSVPEEMDARLTKDIIAEYGLKCSASMV